MTHVSAYLAFAMLVVPGCTQSAATANIAASTPAANPEGSAAVVLADALARADAAATTGKDADLTQPLAIIAMLNAQPLDESGRAELAAWQVRNPEQSAPMRGRTLGPGYRHGTLNAGGDLRIEQTFLSGQKASIALSSPSGARLQLQVIDGKEQPVCQNVAARPSCAWTPMFTQRHVIHLTNPGNQTTRFYLVIE